MHKNPFEKDTNARWMAIALLVLAPLFAHGQQTAADDAAAIRALAADARMTLTDRIEPPVSSLPFTCIAQRTETAPIREYILRQQAEALEALVASATTPADVKTVRRLLDKLQRDGYAREADARLVDTAPSGATGLRLASNLGELPAALSERLTLAPRNCGVTYFGLLGRTMEPLGSLARVDFDRLAQLEPADPWFPLVLAWLAGTEGEPDLIRALSLAKTTPSAEGVRVRIIALQQLAWLRRQQDRGSDAEQAAREAMRIANDRLLSTGEDLRQPAVEQALRDAAQTGSALAITLQEVGQKALAYTTLLDVMTRQRRLIALRENDYSMQLALIDTLGRLHALHDDAGSSARGSKKEYLEESLALYKALEQNTRYAPMLSAWPGMLMSATVMAGALTLILGWILLRRYRKRVAQFMMASSQGSNSAPSMPDDTAAPPAEPAPQHGDRSAPAERAAGAQRRAALVQVAAGLTFGLTAAWLQLWTDGTEVTPNRMALISWTWGWPTVLALIFVWDGDRRRSRLTWAAYFAGLLLISTVIALGETPPLSILGVTIPAFFQGLLFWVIHLSYSPFLLLFLNRAVRSIGPALLAMMVVATLAGTSALVLVSTSTGMEVLASVAGALGISPDFALPATALAGMLASAPLAWWIGTRLRAAYVAKWLSDQDLMIDTLWGFQSFLLGFELALAIGPMGWLGVSVFVLHKAITLMGMAPAARSARSREPLRLLLLRVFTRRDARGRLQSRRSDAERLFDVLGSRWRYVGPIAMIGAPDLASSTIDPDEFLEFLSGRLRQRFIIDLAEVPIRLAAIDDRPDHDARWRVTELFCGNDTWQLAVLGLMARSDLVAMDLRDFGPDNKGCIFELQSLLDLVPAGRIALLVDGSNKQRDFLQSTIDDCFARVPASSPNAQIRTQPILVDAAHGERAAVNELLRMAASVSEHL